MSQILGPNGRPLGNLSEQNADNVDFRGGRIVNLRELTADKSTLRNLKCSDLTVAELLEVLNLTVSGDATVAGVATVTGNLGVGIAPIAHNANARAVHIDGGANDAEVRLTNTATGSAAGSGFIRSLIGIDGYLWNLENGFLSFGTNGVERGRFLPAGGLALKSSGQASGDWSVFERADGVGLFKIINGGTSTNGDWLLQSNSGAGYVDQMTVERVSGNTMIHRGNVGIGVTPGNEKLQVLGNLSVDGFGSGNEIRLRTGFAVASAGGSGLGAVDVSGDTNKDGLGIFGHDGIRFHVGTGAVVGTWNATGLGIGTTPLHRLDVWTGGTLPAVISNNQLMVGDSSGFANAGIALISAAGNACRVSFGNNTTPVRGAVTYDGTNDTLSLATTAGTERVRISVDGFGYPTGQGGTVVQATSKSTGVTLDKVCGEITMNASNLGAGSTVTFVLTNARIAPTDVMVINHVSGGVVGVYMLTVGCSLGFANITVRNNSVAALAEALVLRFVLVKGATS